MHYSFSINPHGPFFSVADKEDYHYQKETAETDQQNRKHNITRGPAAWSNQVQKTKPRGKQKPTRTQTQKQQRTNPETPNTPRQKLQQNYLSWSLTKALRHLDPVSKKAALDATTEISIPSVIGWVHCWKHIHSLIEHPTWKCNPTWTLLQMKVHSFEQSRRFGNS